MKMYQAIFHIEAVLRDIFMQNMKDAMAKIAADVHSYIAAAAAKAPPLVIHVKEGAFHD